ncbi:MAG: hypothetical protein IKT01_06070, partial [Eubacteriaceae bacterium]|nr:hypothetical protein [Eubacteriaceae bacterium]
DLKEGEFTFTLTDSEGNVLKTVTNDAAGKVVFSALDYTEADAGKTYTYYIAETAGDEEGMTYDTHVETLTVKVEDKRDGTLKVTGTYSGDQKFINDVTPPPQTGDMSNLGVWFLMMISSWAFALVLLTVRKQKRMKASKQ